MWLFVLVGAIAGIVGFLWPVKPYDVRELAANCPAGKVHAEINLKPVPALGFDGKPNEHSGLNPDGTIKDKPADEKEKEPETSGAILTLVAAVRLALGDKVSDVRVSKRLTDSAVCLVADGLMDRTLERLLARQKDSGVSLSAPVLEVNAGHALVKALAKLVAKKGPDSVQDAAHLLLDQAQVLEGEPVADPAAFAKRMADVMQKAFG